jgi:TolA-binding protein
MEALRRADKAKKQGVEIESNPVPPLESLVLQSVLTAPEMWLSLEGQKHPPGASSGTTNPVKTEAEVSDPGGWPVELALEGVNEPETALISTGGEADATVVDTALSSALEEMPDREDVRSSGPALPVGLAGADVLPLMDAVKVESTREQRPENAKPATIPPVMVSAESSRQAARTVFAAKKEYQRRKRNRHMLVLGITGGLAAIGAASFFFLTSRLPSPSDSPFVKVEHTIVPQHTGGNIALEPVSAADESRDASLQSGLERGDTTGAAGKDFILAAKEPGNAHQDISKAQSMPVKYSQPQSASSDQPESSAPRAMSSPSVPSTSEPAHENVSTPIKETAASLSRGEAAGLEPAKPAQASIVITHRRVRPQASSSLAAAYEAYQKGDTQQANEKYQQVLRDDPKNRGALLGLAAIATQGHEESSARELYLRLLDQDPGDPLARAGLLNLTPTSDLARQESELKLLLEQHPQSAPLFFSLGSLYASGQRWNEAQQAYFSALQAAKSSAAKTGGVSPDYPFNLAVSLEHLGQLKPAVAYYREAIQCAAGVPTGFDVESLEVRLKTLEQGIKL